MKLEKLKQIVHSKLRQLIKVYNPRGKNPHFNNLEKPGAALRLQLLKLGLVDLKKVYEHHDYFLKHLHQICDFMT